MSLNIIKSIFLNIFFIVLFLPIQSWSATACLASFNDGAKVTDIPLNKLGEDRYSGKLALAFLIKISADQVDANHTMLNILISSLDDHMSPGVEYTGPNPILDHPSELLFKLDQGTLRVFCSLVD